MALITIGTNLIDVADVALVAPSGSTSTVYLADGQQLESALTAAAQAAAVNGTAAGTLLTTVVVSTNYDSCYISGVNTQRVAASDAGTIWYLRGGPGAVVCPTTDLTAAGVLLAAASGVTGTAVRYASSGQWAGTFSGAAGNSGSFLQGTWVRNGATAANPPAPAVGDIMGVSCCVYAVVAAGGTLDFEIQNFPAPMANESWGFTYNFQEVSSTGLFVAARLEVDVVSPTAVRVRLPAVVFAAGTEGRFRLFAPYPSTT